MFLTDSLRDSLGITAVDKATVAPDLFTRAGWQTVDDYAPLLLKSETVCATLTEKQSTSSLSHETLFGMTPRTYFALNSYEKYVEEHSQATVVRSFSYWSLSSSSREKTALEHINAGHPNFMLRHAGDIMNAFQVHLLTQGPNLEDSAFQTLLNSPNAQSLFKQHSKNNETNS